MTTEYPPENTMVTFGAAFSTSTTNVGGMGTTTPTQGDPRSTQPGRELMPMLVVTQMPMTRMGMMAIKEELATATILKVQIPT